MAKKMLIVVAILAGSLFAYNQYQQMQALQAQKKIEAEIQAQNQKIVESFDAHEKKGNPLTNRDRGKL